MIIGVEKPRRPALTTIPHATIDTMKPVRPTSISGLRPRRSEARAQNGEEKAQAKADSEKIAETRKSGMASERPIAGSTEIMPVLPSAVARETEKMIAKARRGRRCGGSAMALMRRVSGGRAA